MAENNENFEVQIFYVAAWILLGVCGNAIEIIRTRVIMNVPRTEYTKPNWQTPLQWAKITY